MPEPIEAPTIEELVQQHYQMLYRYAYRLCGSANDAEDVTQQTYLQAQRRLSQLRSPASARAWLCTILRNCYRKQFRQPRPISLESLESLPADATAAGGRNDDIDEERLQQALGELPEEFRTPVILFYFGELSYREIAEQMVIPVGTVMSRLARGKAHLRARLFGCALAEGSHTRRNSDGL